MIQISGILMDGKSYFLPLLVNQDDKEYQGIKHLRNILCGKGLFLTCYTWITTLNCLIKGIICSDFYNLEARNCPNFTIL